MRAVDAIAFGAEHEIVARGAPGGLLLHVDIGIRRIWRTVPCPWRRTADRRR
jgi:hypothetical protein